METIAQSQTVLAEAAGRTEKTFAEFFAGIGLVREGLRNSGWKCVYANDIDPKKRMQYQARFGDAHFHMEDVRETDKVLSRIPADTIMATASFPCTDLSVAGAGRGFAGEHSSKFFAFADVLARMKPSPPKLVLLENVPGFLTSHRGQDFALAVGKLAELGYYVDTFIVDAKQFVPQSRSRVFVLGVHESDIARCNVLRWGAAAQTAIRERRQHSLRPDRLLRLMERIKLPTGWISTTVDGPPSSGSQLHDVIDVGDQQPWWDEDQVSKHYEMMIDSHRQVVGELQNDRNGLHVGTIFRRTRDGRVRAEVRFDGLAGCLRVPRGGSARQIVIVVDQGRLRMRWMSPLEYARLQGVPDYPLIGTAGQQMAGFGDAVCVPVIRWIDQCVLTPLFDSISSHPELACRAG